MLDYRRSSPAAIRVKHGIKTAAVSFFDEEGVADKMVIRGARKDS